MKYFIGIPIQKKYKNKIEMFRAELRFFTTEPHIKLVPPSALPYDDSFIKQVVEICKRTHKFNIKLDELSQFGNRVLYVNIDSPELIKLNEKIYDSLNLEKEKRKFVPHLTIFKQRIGKPADIQLIKKRAEKKLSSSFEYTINSIVIYKQPKEKFIYIPYMKIPFSN